MSKVPNFKRISKVGMDKLFYNRVKQKDSVVVLSFYSPACGLCHSLKPKLDELKESINVDENKNVYCYAFNVMDEPSWEKKLNFQGVPTVAVVRPDPSRRGKLAEYEILDQEGKPDPKTWYRTETIKEFFERGLLNE